MLQRIGIILARTEMVDIVRDRQIAKAMVAYYLIILIGTLLPLAASADALSPAEYRQLSLPEIERLARLGDARAQVELGVAYQYGEGTKKSPRLARLWYCRAAVQHNSTEAQRNLGWMYHDGLGVARDERVAAYWLDKAGAPRNASVERLLKRQANTAPPTETGCSQVASARWLQRRCADGQCRRVIHTVESLAGHFELDVDLVLAVISAESNFNPRARSPKGAMGVMQLIPETARRFGVQDPWDAEQNIRGGMAYLRWLIAYFEGDVKLALAGYNAGEHKVRRFNGVPPYAETQAYARRILREYGKSRHRFDRSWLNEITGDADSLALTSARTPPDFDG